MMAVQMDNPSELSSRERAQRLYNKNAQLENTLRKSAHARIPVDPNVWQQLRDNYEAIILEDHSFAEQHEVELSLWQLHHKKIEDLRAQLGKAMSSNSTSLTGNGKGGPTRPDQLLRIQSQFKTFLSEATGFYHELMLKIREIYGLPLGYFAEDPENQIFLSKDGQKSTDLKKGLRSCHRCLIYLGDLARYKSRYGDDESKARDFDAASSYYLQAASLWPSSGNPHHQLAILAGHHDEFVAIYRYFRSLAVESPFSTARDNLILAFEKNRQSYLQLLGDSKPSTVKAATPRMIGKGRGRGEARSLSKDNRSQGNPNKERTQSIPETFKSFCVKFVRVNGILFTRTSLETFADVLSMAKNDFMVLLSSGLEEKYNFGSDAAGCGLVIVRIVAILIFTVHNMNRESENQSYAEILQRPVLLQNAYTAIFEFMGHIAERCLQLRDPLSSYLLPGFLVFVEWLACHPDVAVDNEAGEQQANMRLFFWKSCISFFNKLLSTGLIVDDGDENCFFNMSKYEEDETANRIALGEDFELRGFLPLSPAHQILNFSRKHSFANDGGIKEKRVRVQRMIAAGKAFVNVVRVGPQGVYFDPNTKKFILSAEPPLSADLELTSGSELIMVDDTCQDLPMEAKTCLGVLDPAVQLADGEDEEEVIVFKPSAAEKQADGGFLAVTSYEELGLVASMSSGDLGVNTRSVSAPNNNAALLQNGFDTTLRPSASVGNASSQYMHPIQPNTSSWLVEQQASMVNGFKNFSMMDNGHSMNQKPHEFFGTAAQSLPFSHNVNLGNGNAYPSKVSEVVMPFKDDFMSSGTNLDICAGKTHSVISATSRKSPVSRPIRHVGPPPGFTPAAPKYADDPQHELNMKEQSPLTDDYSWLDGYQMPSSTKQSNGFNISTILDGPVYNHVGKSSGMQEAISFPFPGKQGPAFQAPLESHKLWQDYQFPDSLKLYEQQQGNQPHMPLPEYQGQSLWGGRFLV